MVSAIICYLALGAFIGVILSLLFINFDKSWKKIASSVGGLGGSGGLLYVLSDFFEITEQNMKFTTSACLYVMILVSFFVMMLIMCKLIKDKDDDDILRIRDILLGQKSYIDKYYEKRMDEIDTKLNISILEEREKKITEKETMLAENEQFIKDEQNKILELGNKKLRMNIPNNKKIVITENFVESLPSYIGGYSKCISDIKYSTNLFIKSNADGVSGEENIKSYLLSIATYVSQDIFGGNSDIRVHFRVYNEETKNYEKFVSVVGEKVSDKRMTPIPYENSMIEKSFQCKRSLIKSINVEYDYKSNNYTKWKDYMTFSFYNLLKDNKPFLTFGISVKNAARYKDIFYFLSFVELDTILNDYIENVEQTIGIAKFVYKDGDVVNE